MQQGGRGEWCNGERGEKGAMGREKRGVQVQREGAGERIEGGWKRKEKAQGKEKVCRTEEGGGGRVRKRLRMQYCKSEERVNVFVYGDLLYRS